jgi:protocatechuate 3,4-dioxygenase beta subunit
MKQMDRRRTLQGIGAGILATGFMPGCSELISGNAANAESTAGRWITGGTAAMRDAASYPNPFALAEQACSVTCEQILGPCWAPKAPVRQDISEGEPGIPMQLHFRLVDAADCAPLPGAEVEIWHTSASGFYSAEDVEGGTFCTSGDDHAIESYFFRGRAIADADGRVMFDSCFPGWYGGRALHIHLLVRMPDHAGEASTGNLQLVTQFYFPEDLTREIHSSTEGYVDRGQPDRINSNDSVLRNARDADSFVFGIERMEDGAMLAWKTLQISMGESCGSRGFGGFRGRRQIG